mgnify:CR=1 FL=1
MPLSVGSESKQPRVLTVRARANSQSPIVLIPYDQAYESGFEDMPRRVPDTSKINRVIGFQPRVGLDDIIAEVIDYFQSR